MLVDYVSTNVDYERPIKICSDSYWVGFYVNYSNLHCNPYLIIDGNEAVVIDGGSRPDFPTVMMKILQTGIEPQNIKALIYQHYDPDLVGSISNFERIIADKDLKMVSDASNEMFIRHYSSSSPLYSLETLNYQYKFSSGRTLKFFKTPYSHSQGSFITYDTKTKILYTSDLFGSYDVEWKLFFDFKPECKKCITNYACQNYTTVCPINSIIKFHELNMTSNKALRHAIKVIQSIDDIKLIAPQHGSIIYKPEDITFFCTLLNSVETIGIDGIVKD